MSDLSDENQAAKLALLEKINEGWHPLDDPKKPYDWRIECPKCKGGSIEEHKTHTYRNRLRIETYVSPNHLRDCGLEAAEKRLAWDKNSAFEGLEEFFEEQSVNTPQQVVKSLIDLEIGSWHTLEDHSIALPRSTEVSSDYHEEGLSERDRYYAGLMLRYTVKRKVLTSERTGEEEFQRDYFQCTSCGYKSKTCHQFVKGKRRK